MSPSLARVNRKERWGSRILKGRKEASMKIPLILCVAIMASVVMGQVGSGDTRENLAPNPSFENLVAEGVMEPAGWSIFTSKHRNCRLSHTVASSGKYSLKLWAQGEPMAFVGVTFTIPVEEGQKFDFEAKCIADKLEKSRGTTDIKLVIEWRKEDGSEISRSIGAPLLVTQLSRLRWSTVSLRKAEAPRGAVTGVFGIHLCDGPKPNSTGTVYVDDVVITRRW